MRQSLRSGASLAALLAAAAALSACVDDGGLFAREDNVLYDEALMVPDHITPPVKVLPVDDAPEHWRLSERVAAALRERDIPAGTEGESGATYALKGRLEVPQENDGRIRIAWQLVDNAGDPVGEVMQMTAITNATWGTRETGELGMISQSAAESLAPLVPSSALDETQFAEETGEPKPEDAGRRRFGPVTALARKADLGSGTLSDRFVGLANVDEVPTLPNAAEALGVEPGDDEAAARQAEEEAKRQAELPPAQLPDLPEADRVPGPDRYKVPNSTFGIAPAPGDPNQGLKTGAPPTGTGATTSADAAGPDAGAEARAEAGGVSRATAAAAQGTPNAAPDSPDREADKPRTQEAGLAPYWVQVGSYRSADLSEAAWRDLAEAHPKLVEGKPHEIHRADLGSRGVFYRVKMGPFMARDGALGACAGLSRAGVDCFITRDPVSMVANAGGAADPAARPAKTSGPPRGAESAVPAQGGSRAHDRADPPSLPAVPAAPVSAAPGPEPARTPARRIPARAETAEAQSRPTKGDPARYIGPGGDGPRLRGYIGLPGVTD